MVAEGKDQEEDDDSEIMACSNPASCGREKHRRRKLLSVQNREIRLGLCLPNYHRVARAMVAKTSEFLPPGTELSRVLAQLPHSAKKTTLEILSGARDEGIRKQWAHP